MRSPVRRVNNRMRHWIWPAVLGLAAVTLTVGSPAGADADPSGLPEAIDTVLGDPRMEGGVASVVVADAASGDVLYRHRPSGRLMPASNTKLLTSAAAMELLGPGHRFTTDVLADGERRGPVLRGDLYLRGTGDPTTLAEDYDRLAARIAGSGVRRVSGRLIADDTRFDDQRVGDTWSADDESAYYAAQISALSVAPDTDYDTGTVIVEVAPGAQAGDKPRVSVTPRTDYVDIDLRASTVAAGGADTVAVARRHGENTITVTGTVPVGGSPTKEWVTVWEPTGYAAAVFRDALAAHGVRVSGPTRTGIATPTGARRLASHDSMPLKDLLVPFMKLSNNMHAEGLTKTMGHKATGRPGSWGDGIAAVGGYLKSVGVDPGKLRQVDGSGLSRKDNAPADQYIRLLRAAKDEPWFADWYASLPVGCGPGKAVGGTLRSRMCGTPAAGNVRAKTGTLTGASALSGYVRDKDGRELVFSVILNNHLAPSVKALEDAIVVTLASSTRDRAVPVMPRATRAVTERGVDAECSWRKPARC
ncbi:MULTISPECIES: D-alanyl-D-alanine carboxypeptidase/D-alanyl-D-alanine endopeptidase [Streptomyces]|uniref:D-alanyl-D-alanine carboxypeptidase/D-alanyl-D-alanine endopeptidase n=1 Tax=Streptomyces TaxID=1883 RepID=UPI001E52B9EC|nr:MULTISPECIES: D-alanyl-D-alanine carboxypeptidase/D-alanyl-D-alanine-endopeptidase [Streptomyces]UFQ15961.1 D-alanyl-D-alanine carboxypeptidase/D-alanyl-D-alanine-endopeptidase [Streptomyces huasconensis]WCL85565.1 D-alanyl-D-alanine carboxypeptidase/D-alanyl-D-alanine-endopeptidase [Streptomyces sp. JCM 35825]